MTCSMFNLCLLAPPFPFQAPTFPHSLLVFKASSYFTYSHTHIYLQPRTQKRSSHVRCITWWHECVTASQEQCWGCWKKCRKYELAFTLPPSQPPPYVPHLSFSVPHNAGFLLSCSACVVKYAQKGLVHVGLTPLACRALIMERLVNPSTTLQTMEVRRVVRILVTGEWSI